MNEAAKRKARPATDERPQALANFQYVASSIENKELEIRGDCERNIASPGV
jgi:hypothetical protein